MKSIVAFLILGLCPATEAQDLILQTRLEKNTLDALIHQTRTVLNHTKIGDMLKGETELNRDIFYTLAELTKSQNYTKFRQIFSNVFKIDLNHAKIRIRIPKVSYEVETLSVSPLDLQVNDPILNLNLSASLSGLKASLLNGLEVDLLVTNPTTLQDESYLTAKMNPLTFEIPSKLHPVTFDVNFEARRADQFYLQLKNYNLNQIPNFVQNNIEEFVIRDDLLQKELSADSIQVNPVVVRLNQLTRSISFDSFKPILQERLDTIISEMINKVSLSLKNSIGPKILNTVFNHESKSDLIIQNKAIYSRLKTSSFSEPYENQLSFGLTGEICTAESFQLKANQCSEDLSSLKPIREISPESQKAALNEIATSLSRSESDMVLSISEEFINKSLATTVKAKLWNQALQKKNIELGPKGIFMIFNRKTQSPEIYLDALYKGDGKGLKKFLVNERKPLHFPLRISTELVFSLDQGTPHLQVKTLKVVSTQDEIINGIAEYGLETKLIPWMKKRIANIILDMTQEINGQTAIDLALPILKESSIDQTRIESSENGRLNLYFKF
jgi:hypothetical protein